MRKLTIAHELGQLHESVSQAYQAGAPVMLHVKEKPKLHITSFESLEYHAYGHFKSRAPKLAGNVAVRGLVSSRPTIVGSGLYVAGDYCGGIYALKLGDERLDEILALSTLAAEINRPELTLQASEQ